MGTRLLILTAAAGLMAATTGIAAAQGTSAASLSSASPSSAGASSSLPEVVVRARRAQLERRVSKFVNDIVAVENGEGLARWQSRVCPLVVGLPRQEGEFILERISEIARAARVPLAGERCHPNLFVVVTTDPTSSLENMSNRNRILIFHNANPGVINAFIKTPRAVRVWYNTAMSTASGESTGSGSPFVTPDKPPVLMQTPMQASHITTNVVYALSGVFIIADQMRLHGLTRGQFADYVSMVGLSELKPGAHLGDAPSILKLFDGAPEAAPPGMTDWDQAFLKFLYATDPQLKVQKRLIAHDMAREMLH